MTCPACGKQGVHTCSPQLKEVKMTEALEIADAIDRNQSRIYEAAALLRSQAQEIERLRVDAERWKWAKDAVSEDEWWHCFGVHIDSDIHLETLIDTARTALENKHVDR